MGYSVLYIAFGVVALWLLGEVLLQHKARLRWRLLAFAGFLGVVAGVLLPQVLLIVLGAAGFGAGQSLVTLSHRRGFTTGWVLGGSPRPSRRRKDCAPCDQPVLDEPDAVAADYPEDVPDVEYVAHAAPEEQAPPDDTRVFSPIAAGEPGEAAGTQVYSPTPLPDETGEYGIYTGRPPSYASASFGGAGSDGYGAQDYGSEWREEPQPAAAYAYDPFGAGAGDDPLADAAAASAGYGRQDYQQQPYQQPYESYGGYAADPLADPSYDPYGAYPPQHGYAEYPPQYAQDAYQQPQEPSQPYAYGSAADGWNAAPPAGPYGEQQPYVPQQAPPGYDQAQPAEPYEQYPQYESYQPYGY